MRDGSREYSLLWPPLKRDGHCSYAPDGRWVVTDCYPNRARVASVYLCDPEANVAGVLARVHSPLKYHADCRCDLHPRWNRRGDMLCIDSVHEGKRGLYVIPVDEEALAHPVAVKAGRRSLKGMLKRNKVLYHVTRTLKKAPEPVYKLYMLWCHRRYGVQPNTAFFTSYDGTLYNDNPRAVAEALHALSPDTRIQFRLNARGRRLPLRPFLIAIDAPDPTLVTGGIPIPQDDFALTRIPGTAEDILRFFGYAGIVVGEPSADPAAGTITPAAAAAATKRGYLAFP